MPEHPVANDGRIDLYGDEIDTRFLMPENGIGYAADPYRQQARLVLLPTQKPLPGLLPAEPHFSVIDQDSLAVILVRR